MKYHLSENDKRKYYKKLFDYKKNTKFMMYEKDLKINIYATYLGLFQHKIHKNVFYYKFKGYAKYDSRIGKEEIYNISSSHMKDYDFKEIK